MDRFFTSEEYEEAEKAGFGEAHAARHFYELGCRRTAEKYDEIEYKRQRADVSEGLEEEIEMYFEDWDSNPNGAFFDKEGYKIGIIALKNIARHFAKWGAEHLRDTTKKVSEDLEKLRDLTHEVRVAYERGIEVGREEQREELMREAVEGWVARDGFDNTLCFFSNKPHRPDIQEPLKVWKMWLGGCFHLPKQLFPDLKWEDEPKNVKLIIIKEDKK